MISSRGTASLTAAGRGTGGKIRVLNFRNQTSKTDSREAGSATALPFCFKALGSLILTPPDGTRKHLTSCGLLLDRPLPFSYIQADQKRVLIIIYI
jgi:hypothetical protein